MSKSDVSLCQNNRRYLWMPEQPKLLVKQCRVHRATQKTSHFSIKTDDNQTSVCIIELQAECVGHKDEKKKN